MTRTFMLEIRESVGIRYEANIHVLTEADNKEEAVEKWEDKQSSLGGVQDGKHEFVFDGKGYRSELKACYKLPEDHVEVLGDYLYTLSN